MSGFIKFTWNHSWHVPLNRSLTHDSPRVFQKWSELWKMKNKVISAFYVSVGGSIFLHFSRSHLKSFGSLSRKLTGAFRPITFSSLENTTPSINEKLLALLSCCRASIACWPAHVRIFGFSCLRQLVKLLLVNWISMLGENASWMMVKMIIIFSVIFHKLLSL